MAILEAPSAWGPPWVWAGGSPLLWYLRFVTYRGIRIQVENMDQREREMQALLDGLS